MITISKTANLNYLAKVVKLKGLRKHSNADRLQCVDIDFQTVITGLDAKNGDIYVFFPLECRLNEDFLSATNSFRDATKNLDPDPKKAGFFDDKGRVKAMKLRGEKSMGYMVPIDTVLTWAKLPDVDVKTLVGTEFDTIGGILLLEKYQIVKATGYVKEGKKPKLSRLVEGQVRLHVDTENLRKNAGKIRPNDQIAITYKTHGTSWWVGNLKVKRKLNFLERLLVKLKFRIESTEFDWIYGSRRVVKNANLEDPKAKDHFYGYDIWEYIKEEVKDKIPKGFTIYGEALGYGKNGEYIQAPFDYGAAPGEMKLEVYRITVTNDAGFVTELSHEEIQEFCKRTELTPSTTFFSGLAKDVIPEVPADSRDWQENFVKTLEAKYNEKPCFMCTNRVPEEGIVVRKASLFTYEAYKLKSFAFLEKESEGLDLGIVDTESSN